MKEITIRGIKGVNEALHPELLDAGQLADMENMILNSSGEAGMPVKRGAYRKYNTNGAGSSVRSLCDAVDEAGNNYVLAAVSTALKKSADGTGVFQNVKTGLDGYASMRFVEIGNGAYLFTNGVDKPFLVFGAGFVSSVNLEIAAPDVSSIVTSHSSGGYLSEGHYRYMLVYATETGERSNPSQPVTHYKNSYGSIASTDATDKKIRLKNLPVSSDARVTKRLLYRTKALSNSDSMHVYYLRAVLNNSDTTFDDDGTESSDDSLYMNDSPVFQQLPPAAKYTARHRGRVYFGNVELEEKNYFNPPHAKTDPSPGSWTAGSAFDIISVQASLSGPYDGTFYQYRCVFVDENGVESDPVDTPVMNLNGGGAYPDSVKVDLGHIPFAGTGIAARPNVKRRIYRTKRNDSSFYLLGEFDLSTIDQLSVLMSPDGDTVNDDDLGSQYGAPAMLSYKSGIVFSEAAQPANCKAENIVLVFDDDGDEITGIADDGDGILVFKAKSICKIFTSGAPVNWRTVMVSEQTGCSNPESLVKLDRSYFFRSGVHFYKYGGGLTLLSAAIPSTVNAITNVTASEYDAGKHWYVVSVSEGSSNYLLVYDERIGSWYRFTISQAKALAMKQYGTGEGALLIGGVNYLLHYNESYDTDNENDLEPVEITTYIKTATIVFGDGISEVRLRKLFLEYENSGSITVTLSNPDIDGITGRRVSTLNPGVAGVVSWRLIPDAMPSGTLQTTPKISFEITGSGLQAFKSLRLLFHEINRGTRI